METTNESTIQAGPDVQAINTNKSSIPKELKSLGEYNRELSKILPKELFKKRPWRAMWGIFFTGASIGIVYTVMTVPMAWYLKAMLGFVMGMFLGGNAFVAHEAMHGALMKNKKIQNFFGFLGMTPFLISPTYWRFWHNNLHHGNTQLLYRDPDAFPTRLVYKRSKFMQRVFKLTPGSGYLRSFFYFFYWFSYQAVLNQLSMRFGNKMWAKMNHKKVTIEFTLQCAFMLWYFLFIGVDNMLWLFILPFAIQNYTVMSYISTNHNISPYTKINDPLVNSVTVTNNPILELLTLNFGYHTEHHLFPSMPMTKAKEVSKKLQELYPDRYNIMPKWKALKYLYTTPRLYKDRETLVHPESGKEYPLPLH